jgi:two-component system NtrC family sensor kinase
MKRVAKLLCVDDEPNVLNTVRRLFLDEEYELLAALSGEEGLEVMAKEETVQVVISDYRMPGMNGVDFLKEVSHRWPETVRLVLSGYADIAAIVSTINEGKIYKFIPKPWNDDELKLAVAQAVDIYALQQEYREMVEKTTRSRENCDLLLHQKDQELLAQTVAHRNTLALFESLPGGLLVVDEDKVIVQCNRNCRKFFGHQEVAMAGRPARDLLPFEVLSFLDTITEEGRMDTLRLFGRDLQVQWQLMPQVAEQYGPQWLIEFWEQKACQ